MRGRPHQACDLVAMLAPLPPPMAKGGTAHPRTQAHTCRRAGAHTRTHAHTRVTRARIASSVPLRLALTPL